MNPNSNYYLAINIGFPNAYDKANGRTGAFLMIHGDCSSRGCYAMTDEQIGEIYSLARESLLGGQQSFQIQAYPFRMTPANLAHHRTNPNMAVLADDQGRQRPFRGDASGAQGRRLRSPLCVRRRSRRRIPPSRWCSIRPAAARPTWSPRTSPDRRRPSSTTTKSSIAQLAKITAARADQDRPRRRHERVFLAKLGGNIPPARVPAADWIAGPAPARDGRQWRVPTLAGRLFGGLFGSKPPSRRKSPRPSPDRGRGSSAACSRRAPARHSRTQSDRRTAKPRAVRPPSCAEANGRAAQRPSRANAPADAAAKPKPAPQAGSQRRRAAGEPPPINGAQPVVPAGNFDSRWGGLQ